MLSAAELTMIRDEANRWLPSTATILTHSQTPDTGGGFTETYTAGQPMACRLAPIGGGEDGGRGGERINERTTHVLTLMAETTIAEPDRVTVDGRTYEVTLVRKRPALEVVRRVEVREAG
jgi:hypothetical protein